jgi:hypothetical protein
MEGGVHSKFHGYLRHILQLGFLSLHVVRVYQLPVPVAGVAVGSVAGAVGVGVAPVVGTTVGLVVGVVGVVPVPLVESTVGLVVGAVGVVVAPLVGVVTAPAAGLVFWFCVSVLPALKVASIATPLASVVTVIGSGTFNNPTQFSPLAP